VQITACRTAQPQGECGRMCNPDIQGCIYCSVGNHRQQLPLQLWDQLMPQVQDTLNMMRTLRNNPAISACEALNGPYDWSRYPLAPIGCKAVVYEDGDTRGLWVSRGVDAWYLGRHKTITGVIYTTYLKRGLTGYQGQQNCSPNIAKYQI
jgi:hypothetical protein